MRKEYTETSSRRRSETNHRRDHPGRDAASNPGTIPGGSLSTLRGRKGQAAARTELLIALAIGIWIGWMKPVTTWSWRSIAHPTTLRYSARWRDITAIPGNIAAAIAALKPIAGRSQIKAELAYTYQLSGDSEEAAKLYAQAADAAPKELALQLSASQAAITIGALKSAQEFLDRAALIDADKYRVHAIRGEIARLQERPPDAIREYSAAWIACLSPRLRVRCMVFSSIRICWISIRPHTMRQTPVINWKLRSPRLPRWMRRDRKDLIFSVFVP